MFNNIGHVLYHVLIILFPILFYHQFLNKGMTNVTKKVDYRFLLVLLIMLLLTMSFPIEVTNGSYYDQKIIPIILAFTYGGLVTGFAILISMLVYLFILGENGFMMMVINYMIIAVILCLCVKKFNSLALKNKVLIISGLFFMITITRTMRLLTLNHQDQIVVTIIVSLITWISLITVVLIIENLNMQMHLQHELQRSEKLKVVSELAASVAHEVRNPMTSTRGFLQLMSRDGNLNSSQQKYIEISISELDRAQTIIQDYLSLAKPNKQEFDRIDLSLEVENVIQLMNTYTNIQNITLRHAVEQTLYLKANKDEIKQVLINIIKNGIEAVGKEGVITVNVYRKEEEIFIEIADNGVGMSAAQMKKIGTPFYSTKDMGTGIGLTISFQIIELLKGKIDVKSEVGKGTTFTISLPILE
ncbi:ATP-binding protein [Sutcliffiella halmapala]|uniref:ATP-binding protein n=1 Tax=Sutcliffiella halmapala TaxID=79882 RepID=UPI000995CCE2|nr:ATP-binding protein [Sutcliffiella halmapala]